LTNLLILTCRRSRDTDPWRYVRATLEGADRDPILQPKRGHPAPVLKGIVCDGPYDGPRPPGWDVYEYTRPPGTLRTKNKLPYWYLLQIGADLGGDLIALEDDLKFSKHAISRMASLIVPADLAWLQFFSPRVLRSWDMFPGIWRPPLSSSTFLQAVKFPHRTLLQLLAWQREPEFSMYGESDNALAVAAAKLRLDYGVHCPDIVQHVGEVSEAQEGTDQLFEWRTSACWGGEDFDVMRLHERNELYR